MTEFLAWIFLLMMAVPALISLLIGARSLFGYLWNGFWYYVIGRTAAVAFGTPDAQSVGVVLYIALIWRSLVFRGRPPVVFQMGGISQWPGSSPRPRETRDVIDAEVVESTTTQKRIDE